MIKNEEQENNYLPIVFGSSTCYTAFVAELLAKTIEKKHPSITIKLFDIKQIKPSKLLGFNKVIYGIPTWDYGELQEDWDSFWDGLTQLNLTNQQFAIFGVGDQLGYPEYFVDAMGYLHNLLKHLGAQPHGYWPLDDSEILNRDAGYEYLHSKAILPQQKLWCGLPLDEENQEPLTPYRLNYWCSKTLLSFLYEAS